MDNNNKDELKDILNASKSLQDARAFCLITIGLDWTIDTHIIAEHYVEKLALAKEVELTSVMLDDNLNPLEVEFESDEDDDESEEWEDGV